MSDSTPKSIFNRARLEGGFVREDGTEEVLYYVETGRNYTDFSQEARGKAISEYQAMGAAMVNALLPALVQLGDQRKAEITSFASNQSAEDQPW